MRIALDIRCLQTAQSRNRGIGFYTEELVRALLEVDTGNEYLLLLDASLPKPGLLAALQKTARWCSLLLDPPTVRDVPSPEEYDENAEFRYGSYLEATLLREKADLLHVASPFEWELYTPVRFRSLPVVATLFDLIPLVLRDRYLDVMPPAMQDRYYWTCAGLATVDRIVTISECSKADACRHLRVAPEKVDVVHASTKDCYRPVTDGGKLEKIRKQYHLEQGFVLCTGGIDYRKNMERVIEAFSLLPAPLRERHELVIACRVRPEEARPFRDLATSLGVADRLLLTDYVSDDTLATLYSAADAFVFPSLYEGFGLPVLEALRCGAPTVTSNTSSLPEVAGDAALLVDPYSAREIADGLASILTDADLRGKLRAKGLEQAERFSWAEVAEATVSAYRAAVASRQVGPTGLPGKKKRRLAFFSPLSPQRSGISEASEDLLPYLAEHADVDIFVDGYAPTNAMVTGRFPIFDGSQFEDVLVERGYDNTVYEMGNSAYHEYMYPILLKHPGIVVMHDVVLHGLMYHMTVDRGQPAKYVEEMEFCYGEGGRKEAQRILKEGLTLEKRYGLALNRRVLSAATGVVVHSEWAQRELEKLDLGVPVVRVCLGVPADEQDVSPAERMAIRSRLGISRRASFVVASFGLVALTKRPEVLVRAFARVLSKHPSALLVLVGD
nr:glycosyltransferase [Dehalococcoidales bacterium]